MGSTTDTPALATNPKFIFFTDFDGTITTADSNDHLTDNYGFGLEKRRVQNEEVLFERMHFRDSFRDMMDSIKTPLDQCIEILKKNIRLDPGFKDFYDWAQENNVPIVILSGGMQPVIRALLDTLLGPNWNIQVVSNDVGPREGKTVNEEGGWQILFHDERYSTLALLFIPRILSRNTKSDNEAFTGTTSPSRSGNTPAFPTGPPCSTPATACPICPPPRRLTCSLQRPTRVSRTYLRMEVELLMTC